jgi:hypothetical protein
LDLSHRNLFGFVEKAIAICWAAHADQSIRENLA